MTDPRSTVDQIIETLRDTEREQGKIVSTFQQWQPFAEALHEAGFIPRTQIAEEIQEWTPVYSFSSLQGLDDTERQHFEEELNHQAEQARSDFMKRFL